MCPVSGRHAETILATASHNCRQNIRELSAQGKKGIQKIEFIASHSCRGGNNQKNWVILSTHTPEEAMTVESSEERQGRPGASLGPEPRETCNRPPSQLFGLSHLPSGIEATF